MLDDYKYSVGRLVVYKHRDAQFPIYSYGQYGPDKTMGEVMSVVPPESDGSDWVYSLFNVRNGEAARVNESDIAYAIESGRKTPKDSNISKFKTEDTALAEMIAKSITNPARKNFLNSTLKDLIAKEALENDAMSEGPNLPINMGDYIKIRGDLRGESQNIHGQYAKILSVNDSDIAGIENPSAKPGQLTMYRTKRMYKVVTTDRTEADIYDVEVKLFYTANGRKVILNWRAASLLAEAFGDDPPYKIEYEYLAGHIFTREELKPKSRPELAQLFANSLYVKGKLGWRDFQRKTQLFKGTPRIILVDNILELSRFDSKRNRYMTREEIIKQQEESDILKKLLKNS